MAVKLPQTVSQEDIDRALQLLQNEKNYKAKVKAGLVKGAKKVSEMNKEELAAYQKASRTASIRQALRMKKYLDAVAKGTLKDVTEDEIKKALAVKFPQG